MQAPSYPDPKKTAQAQYDLNKKTAITQQNLNNVNTSGPTGSLTYKTIGTNADGTPITKAVTKLNEPFQNLLNTQTAGAQGIAGAGVTASGNAQNAVNNPVTTAGLPQAGNAADVNGGAITRNIAGAGPINGQIANAGQIINQGPSTGGIQSQVANAGNVQSQLANSGAIQRNLGPNDFSGDRTAVEAALRARLNPQFDQQEVSLRTRLAGQGIKEGSEAWNNAYANYGRQRNDADLAITAQGLQEQLGQQGLALNAGNFVNNAQGQAFNQNLGTGTFANSAQAQRYGQNANDMTQRNAAQAQVYGQKANNIGITNNAQAQQYGQNANDTNTGLTAQAQQYGQNASDAGFQNNAQQQAYGQSNQNFANANTANQLALGNQLATHNSAISDAMTLNGQAQPAYGTNAPPQAGVAPVDYSSLAQGQYGAQMGQYNANMGALGNIASTLGGWAFSSPSLKTDVHATGAKTPDGIPVKSFRYKGSPMLQIGVMADEAKAKRPDAVRKVGKYSQVNYDRIASPMLRMGAR